jgi:hypothetical protein
MASLRSQTASCFGGHHLLAHIQLTKKLKFRHCLTCVILILRQRFLSNRWPVPPLTCLLCNRMEVQTTDCWLNSGLRRGGRSGLRSGRREGSMGGGMVVRFTDCWPHRGEFGGREGKRGGWNIEGKRVLQDILRHTLISFVEPISTMDKNTANMERAKLPYQIKE